MSVFRDTAGEVKLAAVMGSTLGQDEITVPREAVMQVLSTNVVYRRRLEDLLGLCEVAMDTVAVDRVRAIIRGDG